MNETMRDRTQIVVVSDQAAFGQEAAERFVTIYNEAVSARGECRVALSGGNTPRLLYERLASPPFRDRVDWSKLQVFFSDERFVPPDSPDSNFHTAQEALLAGVPIPPQRVHRVATVDITPEESASLYEQGIRRVFEEAPAGIPAFDLILLGLGPDGHTASLFPDTEALSVTDRLVAANFVPRLDAWRVTFTYPLIDGAHEVMFLVSGADKSEAAGQTLAGGADLPAARVRPSSGRLIWLLDESAAAGVPRDTQAAGQPARSSNPES